LARGGPALEAAVEAVAVLEDCPALNAGRGAVLRSDGSVALDAAVMDGLERRAGGVAAVRRLRNPVRAALAVLERSPHVLLASAEAEAFAIGQGLEPAGDEWLITPQRSAQLERARAAAMTLLDHDGEEDGAGTVGAVARDAAGHLAAATSTGGMTNALPGRVGDSPVPGAGIWADDATCAVSGTGEGEIFLRCAFAHEVDALLRLGGRPLQDACDLALARVEALGGRGGCAAIDARGRVALPFNTFAMPRGLVEGDAEPRIALHRDDPLDP
ncbi:MAG: isoaspartyl peptidase/L-asparaginase, partial [Deltaproteobacteria bacterium]|nr:isoaspartyl peptidase/L-asparaginase [Deltaproteobacteria bacterium]